MPDRARTHLVLSLCGLVVAGTAQAQAQPTPAPTAPVKPVADQVAEATRAWPTLDPFERETVVLALIKADCRQATRFVRARPRATDDADWIDGVMVSLNTTTTPAQPCLSVITALAPSASGDTGRALVLLAAGRHATSARQLAPLRALARGPEARLAWTAAQVHLRAPAATTTFARALRGASADEAEEHARLFRYVARPELCPLLLPWFDRKEEVGAINRGSSISGDRGSENYTMADLATWLCRDAGLTVDGLTAGAQPPWPAGVNERMRTLVQTQAQARAR